MSSEVDVWSRGDHSHTVALGVTLLDADRSGALSSAIIVQECSNRSQPYDEEARRAQEFVDILKLTQTLRSRAVASQLTRVALKFQDTTCMSSPPGQHPSSDDFRRLRGLLWSHLEEEPLEDGVAHPAEALVQCVVLDEAQRASLLCLLKAESDPVFCASVLRLVGRVEVEDQGRWGGSFLSFALNSASPELREAGVEVIEQWGDVRWVSLLRASAESERVGWLRDYMGDVIEDLCD